MSCNILRNLQPPYNITPNKTKKITFINETKLGDHLSEVLIVSLELELPCQLGSLCRNKCTKIHNIKY